MAKDIFTAEWFPYYFNRFEGSNRVALMSLAEEGAYHRAIRIAWEFGDVPSDPVILAARIQKRCTPKIAERVLSTFVPVEGDPSRSFHPVVEEIRAEQREKFLSSRERGLAGAEARWGKKGVPSSEKPKKPPKNAAKNGSAIAEPMQDIEKRVETRDSDSFSETDSCVRACVRDFSNVDPRLVETAVIKTLITHRNSPTAKPIRSTQYFREEIDDLVRNAETKLGEKAINAMLFSHQQKAKRYLK